MIIQINLFLLYFIFDYDYWLSNCQFDMFYCDSEPVSIWLYRTGYIELVG